MVGAKYKTMKKTALLIDLTYDCNMQCPWCIASDKMTGNIKGPMSLVDFDKLVSYLKKNKFDSYSIEGGEPLLYFEHFKELVKVIKYLHNEAQFKIYTNGTLVTHEIALFLNEHDFSTAISVNVEGYKGLLNFMRIASDGDEVFNAINTLRHLDIRAVIPRMGSFAYESILLHNIFPSAQIESVPDYTQLSSWTMEDVSFIRKELETLVSKTPNYRCWHVLLQGFKHYCRCENKKHFELGSATIRQTLSVEGTSGCNYFRRVMNPSVYLAYQDLCEEFYGICED